jgi:hypothetical protein
MWPEVALIVCTLSLSRCTEWLAGISGNEAVHFSAKLLAWEGFKIRPNRCLIQESRFHLCNQVRASECFDL